MVSGTACGANGFVESDIKGMVWCAGKHARMTNTIRCVHENDRPLMIGIRGRLHIFAKAKLQGGNVCGRLVEKS